MNDVIDSIYYSSVMICYNLRLLHVKQPLSREIEEERQ